MNVVRVGVGVIVQNDRGEVLVGRRKGAHGAGTWGFPGGHLEMGESFAECTQREAMEEAGIEVGNVRFVTVTNDIFAPDKHYITIFMMCDHVAGVVENREPHKLEGWEWHAWDDIPQPRFAGIDELLRQRKSLIGFQDIRKDAA